LQESNIDIDQELSELVCYGSMPLLAKPAILTLATDCMDGKDIEDIIADFQLGNIPQLDNVTAQMALVALSEELKGNMFIKKAVAEQNASQFGKFHSIGIRAFCETISNNPVNITVIEDLITPKLFEKVQSDEQFSKINNMLQSEERKSILSKENAQLNNLENIETIIHKVQMDNLEQVSNESTLEQSHESLGILQIDDHELYCNVVLTLALRLCEPVEIMKIVHEYNTNKKDEICGKALEVIKNNLEQKHFNVEDIPSFIHPTDWKNEKNPKIIAIYSEFENVLENPITFETVTLSNSEPLEKGLRIIKNIATSTYTELQISQIMKYFSAKKMKDFEEPCVQMAFMSIAKRISSPLIVEDLIAQEIRNEFNNDLPILGFKILSQVIQLNPYQILNIEKFVLPEDLAPFTTNTEIALIENVYQERLTPDIANDNLIVIPREVPDEAVKAIPEFILQCKESRTDSVEIPMLMTRAYKELDNIPAQAAMLGIATQFASLPEVYDILAMEMLNKHQPLPVIGAVVLQKVIELNSIEQEDVVQIVKEKSLECFKGKECFLIWENVASFLQISKV